MHCCFLFGGKWSTTCGPSCVSLCSEVQSEAVIVLMMCILMLWLHCIVDGGVVQGVVDGCGSFWERVIEYGVLYISVFVCICGHVSQSCE